MREQLVSDPDHVALSRLVEEISWRIDHGRADSVWELFVPDGVLATSGAPLVGHDAIRAWGKARAASAARTRHIVSGMRFTDAGDGRATGSTLLTVFIYEGDGHEQRGAHEPAAREPAAHQSAVRHGPTSQSPQAPLFLR
jgi:SnoaL-like domain